VTSAPRILFVAHNVPRFEGDAAGSFVLRLAVALQGAGARVHIIAPGAPGLPAHDHLEGVSVERVRYASEARMTLAYTGNMAEEVRGSWSGRLALAQLLFTMRRAVRRSINEARREGDPFDVVHLHWWFPAALALFGSRRVGDPPRVITMHGSDVRLAEKMRPAHAVMRAVLAEAAVNTVVSSWLADAVYRMAPAATVAISPMPVDTRYFRDERTAAPERDGVLFVGRLNAQKGLGDLLAAMADPRLQGTPLHVVGDGVDRAALEQRATALGISSSVRWHGALPQPALVPLYQRAQAVVIPSRGEGLGLVAVEAQLSGTPVVAYADGGLLDVVRAEAGGTLVTPGDVPALADAIHALLRHRDRANQLGAMARDFMLARFTPEAAAQRYLAHYATASGTPSIGGAAGA
jgi:glycosyltransferase involved in cell wall biosynthesis